MAERMLRLAGLDWEVTDLSALSLRPKDLQVRILIQGKQGGGLHLLRRQMGEGEKSEKYGAGY